MKALLKIFTSNKELQRLQDNVSNAISELLRVPLLDGLLLTQTFVATTDTIIEHKLQREPLGWIVIGKNATSDVWEVSKDQRFITLRTNQNVTVTFWIF
jgi:hypothetical protein